MNEDKCCETCKHVFLGAHERPCYGCIDKENWTAQDPCILSEVLRHHYAAPTDSCSTCRYRDKQLSADGEPCHSCEEVTKYSNWTAEEPEPIVKKVELKRPTAHDCATCVYWRVHVHEEPCATCGDTEEKRYWVPVPPVPVVPPVPRIPGATLELLQAATKLVCAAEAMKKAAKRLIGEE